MSKDESTVNLNYSELFGKIVSNGELDGAITSFLYYMFPKELFIRALSLLESSDMFIYVYDGATDTTDSAHEKDTTVTSFQEPQQQHFSQDTMVLNKYLPLLYDDGDLQYRLIVRSDNVHETPIYVDIENWICSCSEFSEIMASSVNAGCDLKSEFLSVLEDLNEFSEDKFGQIDAHSLSMQKYVNHKKLLCTHLLAYSIVLKSNERVLKYYVKETRNVILIPISSIDEWLKLHINVLGHK
ncbi:Suppressor of hydroxyurea sensitivity protein 2 [Nakaseomyces bracarensis]|uniref:Suppressor of hydroxyurea sensitivity protein 2 n=1 Tax=Nakaseomyces bracarensis TaxID=273131 RepID=A0ABR4NYA2_9SACH